MNDTELIRLEQERIIKKLYKLKGKLVIGSLSEEDIRRIIKSK